MKCRRWVRSESLPSASAANALVRGPLSGRDVVCQWICKCGASLARAQRVAASWAGAISRMSMRSSVEPTGTCSAHRRGWRRVCCRDRPASRPRPGGVDRSVPLRSTRRRSDRRVGERSLLPGSRWRRGRPIFGSLRGRDRGSSLARIGSGRRVRLDAPARRSR